EDRALRGPTLDLQLHLGADARQRSQMIRKNHADHGRVWTSTGWVWHAFAAPTTRSHRCAGRKRPRKHGTHHSPFLSRLLATYLAPESVEAQNSYSAHPFLPSASPV